MFIRIIVILLFPLTSLGQIVPSTLGGDNIHGDMYLKRYPKESDDIIIYKKWKGYIVHSNEELNQLYKLYPNCEAIKFEYRRNDGVDENEFILSESIGKFQNLKYLHINSNRIKSYPKSIENLSNLEEIILQLRNKRSIEFEFGNFKNLKHLTIHFADNLTEFPVSIFKLKGLESLKLFRFFSLQEKVLSDIQNLSQLRELFIWDSNLIFPSDYEANANLKTLIIDRYRNPIPSGVYKESLKILVLSGFNDTLNLASISKSKNLENVFLINQNAMIGTLELPKLEHLVISGFKGESISLDLYKLPRIESLWIGGCSNIKTLNNISSPSLKSIWINGNGKLEGIVFDEIKFKDLIEIEALYNKSLKLDTETINGILIQKK